LTIALLYTRVSSDEQGKEGLSLGAQLADCRRYALTHDWPIGGEFQDVMTGKRDDRPDYQALLAEVRARRKDGQDVVVVVKWLHRFGRRVSERVRCWEELDKLEAPIHSVAEGGVVTKLVHDILAAVAEEESRQIGERISDTWQHVTSLGWAKVGRIPWGYQLRPANDAERAAGAPKMVHELDVLSAPYVRQAFERVAAGESARKVARWAAHLPDDVRGGRTISWPTMRQMLRRSTYVGRPANGDADILDRPSARWPAIVTDDVFQRVQERLDTQTRMPHQASGQYLLSGLMRCPLPECGGRMRGDSQKGRKRRYRCASSDPGTLCSQTCDAERVEAHVLEQLGGLLDGISNVDVQRDLRRIWQAQIRAETPDHTQQVRQLEAEITRARLRMRRATEMFVDGQIGKAQYDDLWMSEQAKIADAERQLATLHRPVRPARPTLPPIEQVIGMAGNWAAMLRDTDDERRQRDVLGLFVEKVVPVREGHGRYHADVTWTPLGEALHTGA
jgi:DNA invertase Pin-like site-specific DNA recombinase